MALTLTADQRNALRDQIIDSITGIDDVRLVLLAGDYEAARRLGVDYADDLRLLNECLGWEDEADGEVQLNLPPVLLKRALSRHCHRALMNDAGEIPERADLRRNKEVNDFLVQTCSRLLAEVDRQLP